MSEQAANANTSPASTKKYATNISGTPRTRSKQDNTISNQEQAKNGSGSPEVDINQNVRSPEEISKVEDKAKQQQEPGDLEDDGLTEEEYEVEKILKRRCTEDGKVWLFVKWLGWDNRFNTWEALDRMDEVEQYEHFLKNFEEKRFLPPGTKSANVKGFDRSFLVDSILGAKSDDGKHLLLVKWKEVDFTEWVPAEDADSCCPRMVINFYEKHVKWSNPSPEDQKFAANAVAAKGAAEIQTTAPGEASAS